MLLILQSSQLVRTVLQTPPRNRRREFSGKLQASSPNTDANTCSDFSELKSPCHILSLYRSIRNFASKSGKVTFSSVSTSEIPLSESRSSPRTMQDSRMLRWHRRSSELDSSSKRSASASEMNLRRLSHVTNFVINGASSSRISCSSLLTTPAAIRLLGGESRSSLVIGCAYNLPGNCRVETLR